MRAGTTTFRTSEAALLAEFINLKTPAAAGATGLQQNQRSSIPKNEPSHDKGKRCHSQESTTCQAKSLERPEGKAEYGRDKCKAKRSRPHNYHLSSIVSCTMIFFPRVAIAEPQG
jgi:hypothetical protein